jgi:hypothetical protein
MDGRESNNAFYFALSCILNSCNKNYFSLYVKNQCQGSTYREKWWNHIIKVTDVFKLLSSTLYVILKIIFLLFTSLPYNWKQ